MTFENAFTRDELIELLDDLAPSISTGTARELIRALLAEMDKPGDVWKDAPEWATSAQVAWESVAERRRRLSNVYTRTPPKSRARVIAEEFFDSEAYIGFCEIAILKALAEEEAGKC